MSRSAFITYREFKNNAERLGYDVDLHYNHHQVAVIAQDLGAVMGGNTTIATVNKRNQYWFSVYDFEETPLTHKDWKTIITLCRMLAQTPIEERDDHRKRTLADVLRWRPTVRW